MTDAVKFSTRSSGSYQIGVVTLNRPKKLNSLDREMVLAMQEQLVRWESDPAIVCVWIDGMEDRAFCAGGDVRAVYTAIAKQGRDQAVRLAQDFFEHEYRLDYYLHQYRKPIVVWGSGIIMGGGIGLMVGASHRIVTETSRLAMPEITIGLFPDVGASWFLNQMPEWAGLFLGLTGAQFGAADALYLGLADFGVPSETKAVLLNALAEVNWEDDRALHRQQISAVIGAFEVDELKQDALLVTHQKAIQGMMDKSTLVEIVRAVEDRVADDPWLQQARSTLLAGSPTTACLVYEQLCRGRKQTLLQTFQMELIMAVQCAARPDFSEGVRALLVDKDGQPNWRYTSVDAVPQEWVQAHFQSPWPEGEHPLQNL